MLLVNSLYFLLFLCALLSPRVFRTGIGNAHRQLFFRISVSTDKCKERKLTMCSADTFGFSCLEKWPSTGVCMSTRTGGVCLLGGVSFQVGLCPGGGLSLEGSGVQMGAWMEWRPPSPAATATVGPHPTRMHSFHVSWTRKLVKWGKHQ